MTGTTALIHGDIWTDVTAKREQGIKNVIRDYHLDRYLNEDAKNFTNEEYVGLSGLEDISKSNNLILRLKDLGYSKEDIDKISYKNFINYIDKVL